MVFMCKTDENKDFALDSKMNYCSCLKGHFLHPVRIVKVEDVAQKIQEAKEELNDKFFIMSILNDCVTIDNEEGMKFICIDEVKEKFNTIFKKHFGTLAGEDK